MLEAFGPQSGWDASVTWRSGGFERNSSEFSVRRVNKHASVQAACLTMSGRYFRPVAEHMMPRVLEVDFALPRGAHETSPVGFVDHHDDTAATKHRLAAGDAVHFEPLNLGGGIIAVMW